MTLREQYGLSFEQQEYNSRKFFSCSFEDIHMSLLAGFISLLNATDVPRIIETINFAVERGSNSSEIIASDPWEDMDVGIDYADFYIEEFKLPLADMKRLLYEWLEFVRPGSHEFFEEIEKLHPKLPRERWYLKFRHSMDAGGKRKNICESLTDRENVLCFIQFCNRKECEYLLDQIEKAYSGLGYKNPLLTLHREGIQIKLEEQPKYHTPPDGTPLKPWFKVGNTLNNNGYCVDLLSMKELLLEWLVFTGPANLHE